MLEPRPTSRPRADSSTFEHQRYYEIRDVVIPKWVNKAQAFTLTLRSEQAAFPLLPPGLVSIQYI